MVRRNNKSTESTIVFTRGAGDNSLWDDADLIRLWNAQLEEDQCEKAEDEAPVPSTVSEDGSLITTEDDEVAESEQKSSLRSFQSGQREAGVASAIVTAAPINASVAPVVLHQSMFDRLPADIRQLLVAYFNAGYEAGYFVGKRDGSSKFAQAAMRGNRLARRGDPMKTRSERRRERKKKISSSSWAQRARKRLCRVIAKRCAREEDSHMTAIMQSYAIRRKAQRDAERAAEINTEEVSQSTDQDHQESVEGKAPRSRGGDVREGLSVSAAKSHRRVDARRYPGREAKALRERQSKARTQSLY